MGTMSTPSLVGAQAGLHRDLGRLARLCAGMVVATLLLAAPAAAQTGEASDELSDEQKIFYYLGMVSGNNLMRFDLSEEEVALVQRGLGDFLAGRALELDPQQFGMRAQALMRDRTARAASGEKQLALAFLEEEASAEGARRTESGIVIKDIEVGTGAQPTPEDTVVVHYHGTLRDGTVFDSSVERGQPFRTQLTRVIPCWTEAVGTLKEGGKARVSCPPDLAYGDSGSPPKIPGGAALVFEVELIEVAK